jgi:hypothetical protein
LCFHRPYPLLHHRRFAYHQVFKHGLGILIALFCVVAYAIYRFIRFQKVSFRLGVSALFAILVLGSVLTDMVLGGEDINPHISSSEELIGIYSNGDQSLQLNADGTFEAQGLFPTKSGTWSNHDWSLFLSNTGLAEPRIITINGRFCIAPFYAGVDADMGLILKKESDRSLASRP